MSRSIGFSWRRQLTVCLPLCVTLALTLVIFLHANSLEPREISHGQLDEQRSLEGWSVLVGGVLFTGLLGAFLLVMNARANRAEREVEQRTADLSRALDDLREQKRQRAEAQQLAHIGTWEWRVGMDTVDWSDELYRIFGLAPGEIEMTYESYLSRIHPSDRCRVRNIFREAFVKGHSFQSEERIVRPNGAVRLIESRCRAILDENGKPSGLMGICQDVTERKQAEQVSKEGESRFRTMLKAVPDMIFRLDANGVVIDYKPEREDDPPLQPETTLGKLFAETLPTHISRQLANAIHSARESGQVETFDYQLPVSSGKTLDYEARVVTIEETGTLCIARNITQEKHAVERFRRLVELAPDGIMIVNASGIVQMANPAMLSLLSADTENQILDQNMLTFVPDEEAGNWTELLSRIVQGRLPSIQVESRFISLSRQDFPAEINARHCEWDGHPGVQFIIRDVTERKQAEEQLKSSHRYVRSIIDCSSDMIIAVDNNRLITEFNKAAQRTFGYSPEEVLGKHVDMLYAEPETGAVMHKAFIEQSGGIQEVLNKHKNGEVFTSFLSASPLRDAEGRLVGMMGVSRDITARKQVEQLKNEFISTVSHELRTPLTAILASLELILDGAAGEVSEQTSKLIGVAYENSERLVRLVSDILDIEKIESGNMVFDFKPMRIVPVLEETIESMHAYAESHDVGLNLRAGSSDPTIYVDRDRLIQVVTNLLSNAIRFSPAGDGVEVSVRIENRKVCVAVTDHGSGIPEEFRTRVFQKFAQADSSDRRQKGGTGLGLAISKSIVERLGGEIGFETRTNKGTTFWFDLPEWR